jgi:hypothetical protein
MISLLVERIGRGLYPVDGVAEEEVYHLPAHVELRAHVVQPQARSIKALRLYWAVLQFVGERMARPTPKEALHQFVKLRANIIIDVVMLNGEIIEVPDSIALDRMEDDRFKKFFDQALIVICRDLTELAPQELLAQAHQLLDRQEEPVP